MPSIAEELAVADIFADDSEDERTFYGFSDSEIGDNWVSHFSPKCHKIMQLTVAWSLLLKSRSSM